MKLRDLVGKTCIDIVLQLPSQKWMFNERFLPVYPKISSLFFVDYEIKDPIIDKTYIDLFENIETEKLSLDELKRKGLTKKGIGLCSLVYLGHPFKDTEYKEAHIPMIDFDITHPYLLQTPKKELLGLIKSKIKKTGLQGDGLILSSSDHNYHFIGMYELLGKESLINFLANCLTDFRVQTPNKEITYLIDPAWVGHSLNSLRHLCTEDSLHHSFKRCTGLRITEKKGDDIPKVIDVYEGDKK